MKSETGFDPALLDRFPTSEPRPEGELEELERIWCAPKGWQLLTAVNNNYIGVFYVGTAKRNIISVPCIVKNWL